MFIALHSPLGKQSAHLSEQIWRQSLWTVISGRWGILTSWGAEPAVCTVTELLWVHTGCRLFAACDCPPV